MILILYTGTIISYYGIIHFKTTEQKWLRCSLPP